MASVAERFADFGFDRYSIDCRDERLIGPHGPIRIGNKAFQVLLRLVEEGGRLVTKDSLMSSVWDGTIVSEFSLTSAIKELRRALDDDARQPRFIQSVYGRGYRFLSRVDIIDSTNSAAQTASAFPQAVSWPARSPLPAVSNDVLVAAMDPTPGEPGQGSRSILRKLRKHLAAIAFVISSALALTPAGLAGLRTQGQVAVGTVQPAATRPTLAVLPFEILSVDGKATRLGAGIEDEVIDSLAREPSLRVAGRTLANLLESHGLERARAAGLTHLLEGSLSTDGRLVHVSIRLLRADDGTQMWSDRFDVARRHDQPIEQAAGRAIAQRVQGRFSRI